MSTNKAERKSTMINFPFSKKKSKNNSFEISGPHEGSFRRGVHVEDTGGALKVIFQFYYINFNISKNN